MAEISTLRNAAPRPARGALQVAELARRAGVTPATVRYYARIGLLNPGRNEQNGYRRFTHDDLRRVVFVRKSQALALTISDIRAILTRLEHGDSVCDMVVDLVQQRLEEVSRQCEELEASKERIERALAQWARDPGCGETSDLCPLIEHTEVDERAAMSSRHAVTGFSAAGVRDVGRRRMEVNAGRHDLPGSAI